MFKADPALLNFDDLKTRDQQQQPQQQQLHQQQHQQQQPWTATENQNRHAMSVTTPPPTPKMQLATLDQEDDAPPTPKDIVRDVLTRLYQHHPMLRAPTEADRAKFLEKVKQLPGLPQWMWYGMLHYAVSMNGGDELDNDEDLMEEIDFTILDEVLGEGELGEGDLQGPARLWDMTFYYMFMQLEGRKDSKTSDVGGPANWPSGPSRRKSTQLERRDSLRWEGRDINPFDKVEVLPQLPESAEPEVEQVVPKVVEEVKKAEEVEEVEEVQKEEIPEAKPEPTTAHRSSSIPSFGTIIFFMILLLVFLLAAPSSFLNSLPPSLQRAHTAAGEILIKITDATWARIPDPASDAIFKATGTMLHNVHATAETLISKAHTAWESTCQTPECQKMKELLVENALYRLGIKEWTGMSTPSKYHLSK
ncbi:hypothetical protein BZA77DRAFT_6291 [Pyronema omphalodes]|nr:hypothetical protein BZA77DRAFT_6291 [Pyronema omphalodes]